MTSLLMIVAFVLLLLAALGVSGGRVSLGWMGISVWALALIL